MDVPCNSLAYKVWRVGLYHLWDVSEVFCGHDCCHVEHFEFFISQLNYQFYLPTIHIGGLVCLLGGAGPRLGPWAGAGCDDICIAGMNGRGDEDREGKGEVRTCETLVLKVGMYIEMRGLDNNGHDRLGGEPLPYEKTSDF
ncbi:hypothetical protein CsSME_00042250 [Camellia sinensis var. sinensis]